MYELINKLWVTRARIMKIYISLIVSALIAASNQDSNAMDAPFSDSEQRAIVLNEEQKALFVNAYTLLVEDVPGVSVESSRRQATQIFYNLALLGCPDSMCIYAMLQEAQGHHKLAYYWFSRAEKLGLELARINCQRMIDEQKIGSNCIEELDGTEFSFFSQLPKELQLYTLKFCNINTLLELRGTSKDLQSLVDTPSIWRKLSADHKIEMQNDHLGSIKTQVLTTLKLRRALASLSKLQHYFVGDIDENRKALYNIVMQSLCFAALNGNEEAANNLRDFWLFPIENDEGLVLYPISPTLDTEIYPILSEESLLRLSNRNLFTVLCRSIEYIDIWPKSLIDRFCQYLSAKGHLFLGAAYRCQHQSAQMLEDNQENKTRNEFFATSLVTSLVSDSMETIIEKGIKKAIADQNMEQLDLWLSYKLLAVTLTLHYDESLLKDKDVVNLSSYFPESLHIRDLLSLPISLNLFLNLIDEYIDYHYKHRYNKLPFKTQEVLGSCFKLPLTLFSSGKHSLELLLICSKFSPYFKNCENMNQFYSFYLYLKRIRSKIYDKYPQLNISHTKNAATIKIIDLSKNPFSRQLLRKMTHFSEMAYKGNIPVKWLRIFSLHPANVDNFFVKDIYGFRERLMQFRDKATPRGEITPYDNSLIANALLILAFKGDDQEQAWYGVKSTYRRCIKDKTFNFQDICDEVIITSLEIAISYNKVQKFSKILADDRVVQLINNYGDNGFLANRYSAYVQMMRRNLYNYSKSILNSIIENSAI
ncbi:F-box protein [Candidatus Odyssella thessalonicensis]|uniref:F-box protein n=1 Tax=Candidatus Odyssella thessalonicensis TaxID=84647 RepID=UPI000225AF8A|nr:F-box protein [Candidatus Odyssella thessalonicensis]